MVAPEDWEARLDPECATLIDPEEIGALQISAAFKPTEILDEDLHEFAADHLQAGAHPESVRLGDFVGIEINYSVDERFWRICYVRNGRQMLLVTYNCHLDLREHGVESVDEVLASLSARGTRGT